MKTLLEDPVINLLFVKRVRGGRSSATITITAITIRIHLKHRQEHTRDPNETTTANTAILTNNATRNNQSHKLSPQQRRKCTQKLKLKTKVRLCPNINRIILRQKRV